jgi:hypothetical protein
VGAAVAADTVVADMEASVVEAFIAAASAEVGCAEARHASQAEALGADMATDTAEVTVASAMEDTIMAATALDQVS